MTGQIRCHYDVLDVPRDADAAAIKKAHRKAALRHHPDKNVNKTEEEQRESAAEFKLIQAAYECLSDPIERNWYNEHREMILRGGLDGGADGGDGSTFLYDVMPFQYAGCYNGYDDDDPESFYSVYNGVFEQTFQGEKDGFISEGNIDIEGMSNIHLSEVQLGDSTSNWKDILAFYNTWEGYTSCLSFAWADIYHLDDIREAPNRRTRRLMEEENKKKRKAAKKDRVEDVYSLVRFVKKRDPRVKAQREKSLRDQEAKEVERKREAVQRKKDILAAKEEWRAEAERAMAEQETADLNAGRFRLADLDSDDDYDYGGKRGRKKKGKRKGKGKKKNVVQNEVDDKDKTDESEKADIIYQDATLKDEYDHSIHDDDEKEVESSPLPIPVTNDDAGAEDNICNDLDNIDVASYASSSEESSEEEPDSWRCEICRKDFKSKKQFENHLRSKKHKENLKKYQKKCQKEAVGDMIDEIDDEK